jgi:hypothetical protein
MSESDQEEDKPHQSYTLHGLDGSDFVLRDFDNWDMVFAHMKPRCPKCGAWLSPTQVGPNSSMVHSKS